MRSFTLMTNISLLALVCLAWITSHSAVVVLAQQQQQLQPIGDVLMLVLDSNKDQKVTMEEVQSQLTTLEMIFQEDEGGEYLMLLRAVSKATPKLFQLLDQNGDKTLSKKEIGWITKFEQSLKKTGQFKPFIRECFELLDVNPQDDQLSPEEWAALLEDNPQLLSTVTEKFHKIFPLRPTAKELESFVQDILLGLSDQSKEDASKQAFDALDADKDGFVSRKEVGKAYGNAGRKWMEISTQIKQMGPMLALFGGGGGAGGGGGGGINLNNMKMEF